MSIDLFVVVFSTCPIQSSTAISSASVELLLLCFCLYETIKKSPLPMVKEPPLIITFTIIYIPLLVVFLVIILSLCHGSWGLCWWRLTYYLCSSFFDVHCIWWNRWKIISFALYRKRDSFRATTHIWDWLAISVPVLSFKFIPIFDSTSTKFLGSIS